MPSKSWATLQRIAGESAHRDGCLDYSASIQQNDWLVAYKPEGIVISLERMCIRGFVAILGPEIPSLGLSKMVSSSVQLAPKPNH